MNKSSVLCHVLGSLCYRQPQGLLLVPLFTLIRGDKLAANWPLEQGELLVRLQKSCEMQSPATDYSVLFIGKVRSVPPYCSAWVEGSLETEARAFMSGHGIPTGEDPADHLGSLPLAVSRLEDYVTEGQSETLELLFADYILSWYGMILGKVGAHTHTPLWCTMVPLTRDAIAAMWDELQEEDEQ